MSDSKPSWFKTTLPSRGIFYRKEDNTPLLPKGEVYGRKLTLGEEDTLQSAGIDPVTRIANLLSVSCAITADAPEQVFKNLFPHSDLLLTDRMAIMLAQRIRTHGDEYTVSFRCSQCRQSNKTKMKVADEMDYIYPEDVEKKAQEKGRADFINEEPFAVRLEDAGVTAMFRFMRGKDETALASKLKKYKLQSMDSTDHTASVRIGLCLVEIVERPLPTDAEPRSKFIDNWVRNLTSTDGRLIRSEFNLRETGIDTRLYPTCKNCGTPTEVNIGFDSEFFLPSDD
jgi:hypothetical protein